MSTETLKEFLVRIRYDSDQAGETNMLAGISNVGASVMKLGATILGAGTAIAYTTLKYAENMNSMYLSSQRLGMGIKDIKSMSSAAAELGSSVESAKSSFEAFASFQRHNPFGAIGIMKSMGADVSIDDTNDVKLKKLSDAMQRTIAQRGKIAGTQLNLIQGQQLGLSEDYLLTLMNPESKGLIAKHDKAQEVEKYKEAGEKANKGIIAYDLAQEHVSSNMSRFMIPALEKGTHFLDVFSDNIDKSSKSAAGLSDAFLEAIVNLRDLPVNMSNLKPGETILNHDMNAPPASNSIGGMWSKIKSIFSNPLVKRQHEIIDGLMQRGLTEPQAIGIAANLQAENANFDPKKMQIAGGGGYGIAQWDAERQNNYKKWNNGISMQDTANSEALSKQIDFIAYELKTNKNNAYRAMQRAGTNTVGVSEAVTRYYETPKDMEGEIIRRGKNAQRILVERHPEQMQQSSTNQTTVHIHGVTDPKAVYDFIDQKTRTGYQAEARNTAGIMR